LTLIVTVDEFSLVTVFPKASRIVTAGCCANAAPLADPTASVVNAICVAAPATKLTEAVEVNALPDPPKVPLTTAVPAAVPDVNVAVYVPLLLSFTVPTVPNVLLKTTVPPELVRLFPFPSFNCTVIVEVLVPLAVIELGEALIVD
jgi:hypothetical protein